LSTPGPQPEGNGSKRAAAGIPTAPAVDGLGPTRVALIPSLGRQVVDHRHPERERRKRGCPAIQSSRTYGSRRTRRILALFQKPRHRRNVRTLLAQHHMQAVLWREGRETETPAALWTEGHCLTGRHHQPFFSFLFLTQRVGSRARYCACRGSGARCGRLRPMCPTLGKTGRLPGNSGRPAGRRHRTIFSAWRLIPGPFKVRPSAQIPSSGKTDADARTSCDRQGFVKRG